MRGRPNAYLLDFTFLGNTPAYAGKTAGGTADGRQTRKHPRVCGEDGLNAHGDFYGRETPPRMRGRPVHLPVSQADGRNTPAYAGKTVFLMRLRRQGEKHPRVCGEDQALRLRLRVTWETPPRMRGRPGFVSISHSSTRNTPAYAGKT